MASTRKNLNPCSAPSGELSDNPNLPIGLCSIAHILKSKAHSSFRISNIADGVQQGVSRPRITEVEVAL
jgi:hypothetical protein